MSSKAKKRQREREDWDYADLSGPDPMYKRTGPACIPASSSTTFRVNTAAKGPDPNLMSYSSTFDSKAPYSYSYTPPTTSVMTMPSVPYSSYNYSYPYPQTTHPHAQSQPPTEDALPPVKKQRKKKKDPNEPAPEKRGAMFKKKCPQNILDRVDRVMSQRKRTDDELREEFSVLGSTGNAHIDIGPDASKGNHCKHIVLAVLFPLLSLQTAEPLLQFSKSARALACGTKILTAQLSPYRALLSSELQEIFSHAPPAPNSVINQRARDAYARATGKATAPSEEPVKKRRTPGPEDDCPICYESMHGVEGNALIWCETCANAVHKECFTQWAKSCGQNITCVFCRSPWINVSPGGQVSGKGKASVSEGYINLGSVAGLSQERDTSSYYHGSRRGYRHYDYQDYENLF
ncbi:hypothetical protein BDR04DRAFT_1123527 [Suillus decipiens]|nr:hypothetical protein BDR04DRAFT_1123527 [Suillus decipiens]